MHCRGWKHTSLCETLLSHRGVPQNWCRNPHDQDWKLFALHCYILDKLSDQNNSKAKCMCVVLQDGKGLRWLNVPSRGWGLTVWASSRAGKLKTKSKIKEETLKWPDKGNLNLIFKRLGCTKAWKIKSTAVSRGLYLTEKASSKFIMYPTPRHWTSGTTRIIFPLD